MMKKRPQNRPNSRSKAHASEEEPERIQKLLAKAGIASRRQVEKMIEQGAINVNGKEAKLGDKITVNDTVKLNGRIVKLAGKVQTETKVLIYHKPAGEIVSRNDPGGRPNVFRKLPRLEVGRWISVGRLDINTEGLLMFTTDGELAHKLMHPSKQIDREYAVRVMGRIDDPMLERLVNGVELDDGVARFEDIHDSGGKGVNRWFHVVVMEGRNRVVRRLWESQQCQVSRLIRVRYGSVVLPPGLPVGRSEMMDVKAIDQLKELVEDKE